MLTDLLIVFALFVEFSEKNIIDLNNKLFDKFLENTKVIYDLFEKINKSHLDETTQHMIKNKFLYRDSRLEYSQSETDKNRNVKYYRDNREILNNFIVNKNNKLPIT